MEWHTASWAILLLGIAEVAVLSWVYGIGRTFDNLSEMGMEFGSVVRAYWWASWTTITPIVSLAVFIFVIMTTEATEFNGYVFPAWADNIGWSIGASTLVPFILLLIYNLLKHKSIKRLFQTSPRWCSQEEKNQLKPQTSKAYGIENAAFENT